jgi:4-hydroxy 2-oxovalerate aldolase
VFVVNEINFLDCTLRDGGYYNAWDFPRPVVGRYLHAMAAAEIDVVELGFRFLDGSGFKGAYAFTTDEFLEALDIPQSLKVGVMANGGDLLKTESIEKALIKLFPNSAADTPVDVVRIACHAHEVLKVLPATDWLKERGYLVGVNLMQIADRSKEEVVELARAMSEHPVDVVYFADSMGGMQPDDVRKVISWIREAWSGDIGIHTHDNMGLALKNTLCAVSEGASWVDSTVTGMGRGPGNARTEELAIEIGEIRGGSRPNLVPLFSLVRKDFAPLKEQYGWGTNPYYYLAGKHGIHPTYVQKMLSDSRYDEEDLMAVIDHLREEGGKSYNASQLMNARQAFDTGANGKWCPAQRLEGREVLILGTGPGANEHREAIEAFIQRRKPIVMALNTQEAIDPENIDLRLACHPVRLVADCESHVKASQPLIMPVELLPEYVKSALQGREVLDYGVVMEAGRFEACECHCVLPAPLVAAYALAVAASGRVSTVFLSGFDGYPPGDLRNDEMISVLEKYLEHPDHPPIMSITPTKYRVIETQSVYGMMR